MKIRVKVQSIYLSEDYPHHTTGLLIDHNKIVSTGMFLECWAKVGDRWPVVRNRLLSKGLILTEQMESD